jgi:hypothetical protein
VFRDPLVAEAPAEFLSPKTACDLREQMLPVALQLVYSRCGLADEDSSTIRRIA